MRPRAALLLLAALAATLAHPGSAAEPVTVYGIELETLHGRDRLLVFAEAPIGYELIESDPGTLIVSLPGSVLDPSAARRLEPEVGGPVTLVTAFDRADVEAPEVRIVVARAPGLMPEVSQRGAMLALDFPREEVLTEGLTLQFRDAEIAEVVRAVADATGVRFLFDPRLKGKVTLIVADRVSPGEALELLHSALFLKGFGAMPTPGGPLEIVPIADAAAGSPLTRDLPSGASDAPVTTLVRLEQADAQDVVRQLKPWIGAATQAQAYAPTNSLILSGSERRLYGLLTLVRALDASAGEKVIVRRLRHRGADEVSDLLQEMYGESGAKGARFRISVDERSNALVMRVPAELEDEVRERLERLDRSVEGRGLVDVIPVRYAAPEKLSDIIRELAAGGATASGRPGAADGLNGREFALAIDAPSHSLVARSDPATLRILRDVIRELDRLPPRVLVEALVLQISTAENLEVAFDMFLPLTQPNSPDDVIANIFSNPSGGGLIQPGQGTAPAGAARYTRAPLTIPIVDNQGNPATLVIPRETFVVTAEETEVESRVVLRPHILVASGEEQEIFAGDNVPIAVARTDQTNALQTQQNIQRQDVGVSLRVTPTVGEAGGVDLALRIEVTRLGGSAQGAVGEVGPTIEERSVETRVRLEDGQWAVIGMGHQPELNETEVGTPWLRHLPVFGPLFRRNEKVWRKNHLVIAVQATLVHSAEEQLAETLRQRLGFERATTRTQPLLRERDGRVALLVTTRRSQAAATAVAASFAAGNRPFRVVPWAWDGEQRYDVYQTGFESLSEAAAAAMPLVADGWVPQIVVVPDAEPEPALLHERSLSKSVPPTTPF